jgi:hypothetical protein
MSFLPSVEFLLVDVVGLAASNRREAVLGAAFADATDCSGMTADGFSDLRVGQAVTGVSVTGV